MKHSVEITEPAERELEEAYCWIRDNYSSARAARWRQGLYTKVDTLEQMPQRCGFAPENDWCDIELRQLLYGSYRILFTIYDTRVFVLHIRHGARPFFGHEELNR